MDSIKGLGIDPITAEIIRHGLISIPNQIEANVTRTAFSPLVYEYKDYAVGIVDAEGRLISQSQGGVPLFMANALGVAVKDGLLIHGRQGIRPGDVFISNHAASLGQHLNNVAMYTPVFAGPEQDDLIGFMAVLVHWIDVGGAVVGSCISHETTDIWQEGLQLRNVKLLSQGERCEDIYRIIETNTRFPRQLLGDLQSQLAGCMKGAKLFMEIVERYGEDAVRRSIELMWDRSERAARAAISAVPDGVYRAEAHLDNDGIELTRNVPVVVEVRVHGDEMTVDFSGVSDQVRGPINSGREGGAVTCARIAFMFIASPNETANEGTFRPLHVEIPPAKFLSAAEGAPMGGYSVPLPTVIDTILKAMVEGMPEHIAGGHYGTFGGHTFFGTDPRNGELFQNLGASSGGWGASLGHDGPGPYKTMAHGDTLDIPVEAQEVHYPLRIDSVAIRTDSGGAGEYRGGLGIEKLYTSLADCTLRCNIDRTSCPPWGVLDGQDGLASTLVIERAGEEPLTVLKGFVTLRAGDQVRILTAGGGGYGQAMKREVGRVMDDLRLGYISASSARHVYGLVFDAAGQVDDQATKALRSSSATIAPVSP